MWPHCLAGHAEIHYGNGTGRDLPSIENYQYFPFLR
jgi:hypothetical protein